MSSGYVGRKHAEKCGVMDVRRTVGWLLNPNMANLQAGRSFVDDQEEVWRNDEPLAGLQLGASMRAVADTV